jgi:hypothetical protein
LAFQPTAAAFVSIKAEVPLGLVQSSLRSLLLEEDTEEDPDPTAACKRSVYLCATACESLPAEVIQGADERVRWSGGTGHLVTLTVEGSPNGGVAQEVLWVSAISCFAGSKPNHCHLFSVAPSTRLHCRVGLGRPSHNTEMLANTTLCPTEDQIYVSCVSGRQPPQGNADLVARKVATRQVSRYVLHNSRRATHRTVRGFPPVRSLYFVQVTLC